MSVAYSDRNLLFGVLALQMDFIDRDALISALHAWVQNKAKTLGDILVEQKALRPDERDVLDALVQKHLDRHRGDIEKSLAAVAVSTPVRQELRRLDDPDVQASLNRLPMPSAPDEPGLLGSTTAYKPCDLGLRYQILRSHDKGGIGEVFVALDQELNRQVALKEIQERHADDAPSRGRFVREAEITGGLEHPGIVPVYGLGQYADGRPFYAMRFIQGETLHDSIARHHRKNDGDSGAPSPEFELRTLLTRFVVVCNTIAYAHSRGVIHRDLKPSNIMLGKYGETLVVDWGMAKAGIHEPTRSVSEGLPEPSLVPSLADAIQTQAGATMGTPAYMSPEQASGRLDLLGPASDIYSLGATLYTLLTGRPPIEGKDTAEILRKAQRGEWQPPRQVKPDVSPALDAICRKAMAPVPSARYGSALELAADIEHWLADEPVAAYPEPWRTRSRRWMRRHRTLVSAAVGGLGIALLSVTIGLAIVGDAWNKETAARKTAEDKEREARKQKEEARYNQYVAAMNLVQREYEDGNLDHVRELLAAQVPREAEEEDFRNFEWHYWQRLSHRELLILEGHKDWSHWTGVSAVQAAAFSPDGLRIASGSRDNTVRVWDAADGRELLCLKGHTDSVWGVVFSPDGQRLASASSDKTVRVWEAIGGRELLCLKGHTNRVWGVAFSPDGRRLISWGLDARKVRVWDTTTGREIFARRMRGYSFQGPTFSPDSRRLACVSEDGIVREWDIDSGQELLSLKGHTGSASLSTGEVVFSPDGRRLASVEGNRTIRVWDTFSGQELLALTNAVSRVAFSPDGRRLAAIAGANMVQVWDAVSGQALFALVGAIGNRSVMDVRFSPNGQRLAVCDYDGVVRIHDATNGGRELLSFKGHTGPVVRLTFGPDGRRLASAGADGSVRVWDAGSGSEPLLLKATAGTNIAFSPDGRLLALVGKDGSTQIRDTATGQERFVLHRSQDYYRNDAAFRFMFSPDGRRLASYTVSDKMVRVWDVSSGEELLCLKSHTRQIRDVAFSPDGRRLVASTGDVRNRNGLWTVQVWDAYSGLELHSFKGGGGIVAFSPDGRWLASTYSDETSRKQTVRIWDAASGQELLDLPTGAVFGIGFSPDGRRLASANHDRTVRVWDTISGQELLVLKGHTGSVFRVAYSPDGRRLASRDSRGTVRVWDAIGVQELLTFKDRESIIPSSQGQELAFSPDGRRLASMSKDGTVRVWEASPVSAEISRRRALVGDVEERFDKLYLRQKVLDALQKDTTLNKADREFALSVAQTHSEDAWALMIAAWRQMKPPTAGKDAYARALCYAEVAVHLIPEQGYILNTLGVAQYRLGRYADALATLMKSEKLNTAKQGSLPADLAFLAMTQHQLGKNEEAKSVLGRLRKIMKQPYWTHNAEAAGFLREAEELIESKAANKGR